VLSVGFVSLTVCSMAQERVVIAPNGATQSSVREVVATGFGINPQKAEEQALMAAVRSAIGVYLDAKTIVANEDVIQNRILSLSNGFVKEYAAIKRSGPSPDGLYEVTIAAKVESSQLMSAMKAANIVSGEIQGRNLWAESATKIKGVDDAVHILQATIRESCEQLVQLRFLDQEGRATDAKTPAKTSQNRNEAELMWYVATSVDQDAYFKKFAPLIVRCLQNITNTKGKKFEIKAPRVEKCAPGVTFKYSLHQGAETPAVPFEVAYRRFELEEIPILRDLNQKGGHEHFVVERASRAKDFLEITLFPRSECQNFLLSKMTSKFGVAIEVLDVNGELLGKGKTDLRYPFSLGGDDYSRSAYKKAVCFSGVGPFVITETDIGGRSLYAVDPVRAVSVKMPVEQLKDVHRVNCFLDIPEIEFKVEPPERR
jgi:hypothetical protein